MQDFAFYSPTLDALPEEQLRRLGGTPHGRAFEFAWPDLTVVFREMPADEVDEHLIGFRGYVTHLYGGDPDERGFRILDRIGRTRLVVRAVVDPGRDEEGRADALLGEVASALGALMFHGDSLFDSQARLILAPGGEFDPDADDDGPTAG